MLNVNTIKNGLVIDHIRAGSGWEIYQWLGLDKAPFTSCLIQNVHSEKSGKKDIIKIDAEIDVDVDILKHGVRHTQLVPIEQLHADEVALHVAEHDAVQVFLRCYVVVQD